MMENKLILIGGGEHCRAVIDIAEQAGRTIVGILDTVDKVGQQVLGYPIIGTDDEIADWTEKATFLVTVGQIESADTRIKLHEQILHCGGRLDTLVAPTAYVSKYASLGAGTVVMHGAIVNADARIGRGCIVNTQAVIEHDVLLEDYCHVSVGSMVTGNCKIGKGTFLGSGSVLVNGAQITGGCIIGAGAVVTLNPLTRKGVYAGNPAILKRLL